jgi:DNA end-binding protein Ku
VRLGSSRTWRWTTRTIEIDEFVDRSEIDPRYLIRPYYLRPDGKVGHDAFAVIRETIREMNKVAIGRVVLTNREHIIALEPLDKGLIGTLLRYPYEVRSEEEYFDEIQDVKSARTCSISPGTSSIRRRAGSSPTSSRTSTKPLSLISLTRSAPASQSPRRSGRVARTWFDLMDALKPPPGLSAVTAFG